MSRHALSAPAREVLRQYAWSNVMLAFDFDGTLAPIVRRPEAARLRATTQRLLTRAAALYPVAVLSGRTTADLRPRLEGCGCQVVGNYGAASAAAQSRAVRLLGALREELETALGAIHGVEIEDKGVAVAVHYRRCRSRRETRAAIRAVLDRIDGVRVLEGKLVFNVLAEDGPHKGFALRRVRSQLSCDTAIYVGDDRSDEDVFALQEPGRLLKIRIGTSGSSLADYHLRRQEEIDALLGALIELRVDSRRARKETA